jgi:hypothetical protein
VHRQMRCQSIYAAAVDADLSLPVKICEQGPTRVFSSQDGWMDTYLCNDSGGVLDVGNGAYDMLL